MQKKGYENEVAPAILQRIQQNRVVIDQTVLSNVFSKGFFKTQLFDRLRVLPIRYYNLYIA